MRHPIRTLLVTVILLAVAAALGWTAFRQEPVPVDLARVTRGDLLLTVEVDGRTRIREVYDVVAPMSGMARRAPVRVGDPVVKNETLVATVDPAVSGLLDERTRLQALAAVREAEASLHVAETQVREAEEQLGQAQDENSRVEALVARGVMPERQLEDSRRTLAIREAAAARARASLQLAEGTLERSRAALIEPGGAEEDREAMRLFAPADGRVLSIEVVSAQPVAAGTPLLSIGDPADLEIVADLLSTDAVRLPSGAEAVVDRWGGDSSLAARLRTIEPAARTEISALGLEEQRVDAVFDITSPPEERRGLGAGFAVRLEIVRERLENVVLVPLSALFRVGEEWHVYVVIDAAATDRSVRIGKRNASHAQILSGLQAGEEIILYPGDNVEEGARVRPRGDGG